MDLKPKTDSELKEVCADCAKPVANCVCQKLSSDQCAESQTAEPGETKSAIELPSDPLEHPASPDDEGLGQIISGKHQLSDVIGKVVDLKKPRDGGSIQHHERKRKPVAYWVAGVFVCLLILVLGYHFLSSSYNSSDTHISSLAQQADPEIAKLGDLIETDPANTQLYYERGKLYVRRAEYEKAVKDFSKAIAISPDFTFAYGMRGVAYGYDNQRGKAISDFDQALKLEPHDPWVFVRRAEFENRNEQYAKAMADLQNADAYDPYRKYSCDVASALSTAYDSMGSHATAIAVDSAILAKNIGKLDEQARLSFHRGLARFHAGDFAGATGDLQESWKQDGTSSDPLFMLAIVQMAQGDVTSAERLCQQGMALQGTRSASGHRLSGEMYRVQGEPQKAILEYTTAINQQPRYAPSYRQRGAVYLKQGATASAISDFQKAVELNPTSSSSWSYLALARATLAGTTNGASAESLKLAAQQAIDKAFKQTDIPALSYCNRAGYYIKLSEWNKAKSDATKALALDAQLADAYEYLSVIAKHFGDDKTARKEHNEAMSKGYPGSTPPAGW